MSGAPQRHVFYALQHAISREVKIKAILPHLVQKKVIPEGDIKKYEDPKKGIKHLINFLRSLSFETFLDFIECILLVEREAPIVDSIIKAVQEFDQQNNSTYAQKIADVQQKYTKLESEAEVEQPLPVRKEELSLIGGKQMFGISCM